jgi:hypothetical protein
VKHLFLEELLLHVKPLRSVYVLICNIPGFEVRKRENTEVCSAFMHRKSRKFSRIHIKHKAIEVSLTSMELIYLIGVSAINFSMTFVELFGFGGNNLNSFQIWIIAIQI